MFREFPNLASNTFGVSLDLGNSSIYYWKKEKNSFGLYNKKINEIDKNNESRYFIPFTNDLNITSFSGDLFNKNSSVYLSFFNSKNNNFAVVSTDSSTSKIKIDETQDNFRIKSRNQLFFGTLKFNGLKKLCANLPGKNEIIKIDLLNKGRKISASNLIEAENIDDYFIKNLNQKHYHLIYSDKKENIITVKPLK